jgi:hypothetical protein
LILLGLDLLWWLGWLVPALFALEWWRLRGKGPALVLKEFQINREPGDGDAILVRGRPAGILAWLLTLLRIEPERVLRVTARDVTLELGGLYGFRSTFLRIEDVASATCGYYRAFSFLLLSVALLTLSAVSAFIAWSADLDPYSRQAASTALTYVLGICLILAGAFYVVYALSKRVFVEIESSGGGRPGIAFKRSVIENTVIELDQALDLVEVLNNQVLSASGRSRND